MKAEHEGLAMNEIWEYKRDDKIRKNGYNRFGKQEVLDLHDQVALWCNNNPSSTTTTLGGDENLIHTQLYITSYYRYILICREQ